MTFFVKVAILYLVIVVYGQIAIESIYQRDKISTTYGAVHLLLVYERGFPSLVL